MNTCSFMAAFPKLDTSVKKNIRQVYPGNACPCVENLRIDRQCLAECNVL